MFLQERARSHDLKNDDDDDVHHPNKDVLHDVHLPNDDVLQNVLLLHDDVLLLYDDVLHDVHHDLDKINTLLNVYGLKGFMHESWICFKPREMLLTKSVCVCVE